MYARHDDDFRSPAPGAGGLLVRLAHAVAEQMTRWRRTRDENLALRQLARMDDHILRDIGAYGHNFERLVIDGRDD